MTYTQHRDTQDVLEVLDRLEGDPEHPTDEEVYLKFGYEEDYLNNTLNVWQKVKPKMWTLFDDPSSSQLAKVRTNRTNKIQCNLLVLNNRK